MRDIALVFAIFAALGVAIVYPFAGVILWTWFTVQNPHEEAYGFSHNLPLNLIIAVVTIGAWLVSRDRKMPPGHFLIWAMLLLLVWMTFNSFFAYSPAWSWPFWSRTWKIFALGLIVATMATNRIRIHAMIWAIVISLFYYGVKGGIFTLVTGGNYHVLGPESSIISGQQPTRARASDLPPAGKLSQNAILEPLCFLGARGGNGFHAHFGDRQLFARRHRRIGRTCRLRLVSEQSQNSFSGVCGCICDRRLYVHAGCFLGSHRHHPDRTG